MYVPSYPNSSNLVRVSKENPCPHCGKPDWCYSVGELSVCKRNQPPATGWEATSKADAEGTLYYAPVQEKKPIRPARTRYWEYPARDGSKLARVKRIDYGDGRKDFKQEHWNGKRWIPTLDGIDRADVPVYRYADIRQAIANKQPIFLVEGEPCADALWDLGLAATCNIGGCKKWKSSDTSDLTGAQVAVIVPDRDVPGIEHADCLAQEFPDAQWLYPYPEKSWDILPKSQGLDIQDWIESRKLTAEDILAAVGEKKLAALQTPAMPAKILSHPKFETPDLDNLGAEINELLDQDLKRSQLRTKLAGLAQKYRLSPGEVDKIYRDREQELEQEADREDVAAEVARLLDSKKSQINISEIIPAGLAAPIEKLAALLNLRPECYLTALLTQASSLFKVGTEVMLRRDSDFRATPNYFAGIVAESSQKKTPIMQAIIDRPMRSLREKARQEFEKAQSAYEEELSQWKAAKKDEERGPAPKPPRQKLYSFSKTTGEGILYQVAEHPDQGLMYRCDELAGLFKSANQYRGGKGSDEEDLLEFWGGTVAQTVLRASGTKADLEGLLLSVFGTIQPDVLASFLKDCSDSNGKFARFDFVIQPLAASKPPLDDNGRFDITPMLTDLYTKIDALPAIYFELDREAKRYFTEFLWAIEHRRVHIETMQGKRAMVGKMPTKVGKLCIVIHALNCIFNNRPVTPQIPKQVVEAAVKFVAFTSAQIDVLYTEFADRKALAPNLAKIIGLAERKGGSISASIASKAFGDSRHRPKPEQIREWFGELASMKYGEVTTKGRSISFNLYPLSPLSPLGSNNATEAVSGIPDRKEGYPLYPRSEGMNGDKRGYIGDNLSPFSKPCQTKGLDPIGDKGDTKTHLSQNSNALMMSCTTEIEHEGPGDIRLGDRVEVVGSDIKHYNGVTGTVADVWVTARGKGYTVEFDKPISNANFCDFPDYEVRKLRDSEG